jgi:hypothetical protein
MTYYSGKDGYLVVEEVRMGRVSGWSLTSTVESLEVTSLADTARDYVPGLKGATGSCSIWYYSDTPKPLLKRVLRSGPVNEDDIVTIRLHWGDKKVSMHVLITTGEVACQVGEVMQARLNFTVCGDLKEVEL